MRAYAWWAMAIVSAIVGCGKSGAEKRAEELAASASKSAAALPSASSTVDEAALAKYVAAQKQIHDRTVAYMTTLQKIYLTGAKEDIDAFRAFFPPGADADKTAGDISKEAAFTGKQGLAIRNFEVHDGVFDDNDATKGATVEVWEEQSQRGKSRCMIYKLRWTPTGDVFYRTDKTDIRIIACPN